MRLVIISRLLSTCLLTRLLFEIGNIDRLNVQTKDTVNDRSDNGTTPTDSDNDWPTVQTKNMVDDRSNNSTTPMDISVFSAKMKLIPRVSDTTNIHSIPNDIQ